MLLALRPAKPRSGLWGLIAATAAFLVLGVSMVAADAIVHSFNAKSNLQPGWVVALDKADEASVVLASSKELSRIYGVVIDPNSAPLTVQKQAQQVFVATSGEYPVLISTGAGAIKNGDYLSMSNTDGIAAKARSDDQFVVGRALQNFDGSSSAITYASDGSALGRIEMQVSPGKNPTLKDSAFIPQSLKRAGDSIAGKPVSPLRIYCALAVFVVAGLIAVILLSGGIRSSMVAIGRNPLSRHSIMKGLAGVMLAAAGVLIIGLLGVYLLLKI